MGMQLSQYCCKIGWVLMTGVNSRMQLSSFTIFCHWWPLISSLELRCRSGQQMIRDHLMKRWAKMMWGVTDLHQFWCQFVCKLLTTHCKISSITGMMLMAIKEPWLAFLKVLASIWIDCKLSLHLTRTPPLFKFLLMSECLVIALVKSNGLHLMLLQSHIIPVHHSPVAIGKLAFGKGFHINGGCTMMMVHCHRWDFIYRIISWRIGLWFGLHIIHNIIEEFHNFACDRLQQSKLVFGYGCQMSVFRWSVYHLSVVAGLHKITFRSVGFAKFQLERIWNDDGTICESLQFGAMIHLKSWWPARRPEVIKRGCGVKNTHTHDTRIQTHIMHIMHKKIQTHDTHTHNAHGTSALQPSSMDDPALHCHSNCGSLVTFPILHRDETWHFKDLKTLHNLIQKWKEKTTNTLNPDYPPEKKNITKDFSMLFGETKWSFSCSGRTSDTIVEDDNRTNISHFANVAGQEHIDFGCSNAGQLEIALDQGLFCSQCELSSSFVHQEHTTFHLWTDLETLWHRGQRHVCQLSEVNMPGDIVAQLHVNTSNTTCILMSYGLGKNRQNRLVHW